MTNVARLLRRRLLSHQTPEAMLGEALNFTFSDRSQKQITSWTHNYFWYLTFYSMFKQWLQTWIYNKGQVSNLWNTPNTGRGKSQFGNYFLRNISLLSDGCISLFLWVVLDTSVIPNSSFKSYLTSTHYVPGALQGTADTKMNVLSPLCSHGDLFLAEKTWQHKTTSICLWFWGRIMTGGSL